MQSTFKPLLDSFLIFSPDSPFLVCIVLHTLGIHIHVTWIGTACSGLRRLLNHPLCTVCLFFACLAPISFRSLSFFPPPTLASSSTTLLLFHPFPNRCRRSCVSSSLLSFHCKPLFPLYQLFSRCRAPLVSVVVVVVVVATSVTRPDFALLSKTEEPSLLVSLFLCWRKPRQPIQELSDNLSMYSSCVRDFEHHLPPKLQPFRFALKPCSFHSKSCG